MRSVLIFLTFFVIQAKVYGSSDNQKQEEEEHKTVKIGNFSLPTSQQPSSLVGFGQNIIGEHQVQINLFGDDYIGRNKYFIDVIPYVLYGISDKASVLFSFPVAARYKEKENHSDGLEDFSMLFEYAFYSREDKYDTSLATVVAGFYVPTGSSLKVPPTGFGTPAVFIGVTYNHTAVDWLYFTSYGATFSGSKHRTKIGNQYFYEGGFGRNIISVNRWIFAWMVEIDGEFAERNKIRGKTDPNSGGNVIFLTPSLWISSEHVIIQFGVGYAIQQHLFGKQGQDKYSLVYNLGWTF